MDDYQLSEDCCPKCGAPMHYAYCDAMYCDDGYVSLSESEPDWYGEDAFEVCDGCHGRGVLEWCPRCGHDHSSYLASLARLALGGGNNADG
jgi:predicted CxxxxCH...CXXCH cytochrome family protein